MELSAPARRSTRTRAIALAGAGVLVLVGVGVVAMRSLSGADAGAASPQAAMDEMFAALSNEDPLGVVSILAPGEARAVDEFVQQFSDATDGKGEVGKRLEDNGIQLDPDDLIPGFSLSFSNLEYDVEELHSDVAKVTLTNVVGEWSFNAEEFAAQIDISTLTDGSVSQEEMLDELQDDGGSFDESDLDLIDGEDPFVMVTKDGDGWFISPSFTALEYVRVANDLPAPDFSEPQGSGASSPEAALEDFVEAATSGDVGEMIAVLPPDRYRAFYAYQDALEELAGNGSGAEVNVEVNEVELFGDPRGQGVTILEAVVEWQVEGWDGTEYFTATVNDECIDLTSDSTYGYDEDSLCLDDFDAGAPFENGLPGIDRFWVIQQQHGGKWYVDPIGTVGSWLAALDTDQIANDIEDLASS